MMFFPDQYNIPDDLSSQRSDWESYMAAQLSEVELKFFSHSATLDEWIHAVEGHIRILEDDLENKRATNIKTGMRDAVLLDIVIATENESSAFDVEGESVVYGKGEKSQKLQSSLHLKRYVCPDEFAERILELHANPDALDDENTQYEQAILMTSFHKTEAHFVAVEMWTQKNQYGGPITAILGIESTEKSLEIAQAAKLGLAHRGVSNTNIAIYPAGTQSAPIDCLMFSVFHALKLNSLQNDGPFYPVFIDLLEGYQPEGSVAVGRGYLDVYAIPPDSKTGQIIPPEIIKEMQGRDRLIKAMEDRGWSDADARANKKGDGLVARYDDNHKGFPWSASMAKKRIKYFKRALVLLNTIREGRSDAEALALLNKCLAKARYVVTTSNQHTSVDYSELIERERLENKLTLFLKQLEGATSKVDSLKKGEEEQGSRSNVSDVLDAFLKQAHEKIKAIRELPTKATGEIGVPWRPTDPKIEERTQWQQQQVQKLKENLPQLTLNFQLLERHSALNKLISLNRSKESVKPILERMQMLLGNIESEMTKISLDRALDKQADNKASQFLALSESQIASCRVAVNMADEQFPIFKECNRLLSTTGALKNKVQQLDRLDLPRPFLEEVKKIEALLEQKLADIRELPDRSISQEGIPWQSGEDVDIKTKAREQWYAQQLEKIPDALQSIAFELNNMTLEKSLHTPAEQVSTLPAISPLTQIVARHIDRLSETKELPPYKNGDRAYELENHIGFYVASMCNAKTFSFHTQESFKPPKGTQEHKAKLLTKSLDNTKVYFALVCGGGPVKVVEIVIPPNNTAKLIEGQTFKLKNLGSKEKGKQIEIESCEVNEQSASQSTISKKGR
ncbi:MAG: hypothetical protein V4568_00310 [Pseudomonadota bacterium]